MAPGAACCVLHAAALRALASLCRAFKYWLKREGSAGLEGQRHVSSWAQGAPDWLCRVLGVCFLLYFFEAISLSYSFIFHSPCSAFNLDSSNNRVHETHEYTQATCG